VAGRKHRGRGGVCICLLGIFEGSRGPRTKREYPLALNGSGKKGGKKWRDRVLRVGWVVGGKREGGGGVGLLSTGGRESGSMRGVQNVKPNNGV